MLFQKSTLTTGYILLYLLSRIDASKHFHTNFGERHVRNFNDSGSRRNFGPREMHKAICAECKQECEVPFKPKEDRPVYCRECYAKKRNS